MSLKIRDKIFIGVAIIAMIFGIVDWLSSLNKDEEANQLTHLQIGQAQLWVEESATPEKMYKGLGEREYLADDEGMVFLHSSSGRFVYSMRDMKIDLDFIFISQNKVVDIAESVPANYTGTIQGAADYDKVIEVNSGWVSRKGVQLGDEISLIK